MTNIKTIVITALVALVVSLSVTAFDKPTQSNVGGGLSQRDIQAVSLKLGDSGTYIKKEIVGTCNASMTQTLPATTTREATCTVTGVASGDNVQVTLPSRSGNFNGFVVTHASASTNTITFGIMNLTGTATTSFPLATTSVMYRVTDF